MNEPRRAHSVYPIRVAVVYYSRSGAIELLAQSIAEGARDLPGVDVRMVRVSDWVNGEVLPDRAGGAVSQQRTDMLNQLLVADAIVVGSPGYFGSMAAAVKRLFEECVTAAPPAVDRTRQWRQCPFRNKVGGAFTATATPHGGNETALQSILAMLMHLGMIVVTPGQTQPILEGDAAPYGPTGITGPEGDWPLSAGALSSARAFGRQIGETTSWIKLGQARWPGRGRETVARVQDSPPTPG